MSDNFSVPAPMEAAFWDWPVKYCVYSRNSITEKQEQIHYDKRETINSDHE